MDSCEQKYSVIGKPLPLEDAAEKVMGTAKYVDDIHLPGMLYGKILRSPYAHANIVNIDSTKAEKLPGVRAVFTYKNVPRRKWPTALFPISFPVEDTYILDEKVRYVGDEVAAVIALDEDTAEDALELIEVEYEMLPKVSDPLEALKPGAPEIHPGGNLAIAPIVGEKGDVENGFKEADYIFEDTYTTQAVQAAPMEPRGVLCEVDANDNLTVYESNQEPFHLRIWLSKVLKIPQNKIRVRWPFIGGGFGSKTDLERKTVLASLGAFKTKRPVKIIYNRKEETLSRTRHATIQHFKVGVKRDGTLTAIDYEGFADTGAYLSHGPGVGWAMGVFGTRLYTCPNIRRKVNVVYTNKAAAGAFRGYGDPQGSFARELIIERMCKELGFDSVEWRMKNCMQAGDEIETLVEWGNVPIASCFLPECLKKGAEEIGWGKKKKLVNANKRRGVGVSCMRA